MYIIQKLSLAACLFFFISSTAAAQLSNIDLEEVNEKRIAVNSTGMLVLGGWALSNLTVGGIGMTQTSGSTKYFHQMNAAWNSVNLAIAGFGYYGLRNQSADMSLSETLRKFHNFEKILLFNAGLDIGYIAIGGYLLEQGIRTNDKRLVGYGQSMILQGGFLFVFDAVLYFISRSESSRLVEALDGLQFSGNAVSVSFSF